MDGDRIGGKADRLQARRESYATRGKLYRLVWLVAGSVVLLAGVVMTVLPGPGIVFISAGLVMLSFEFV